MIETTHTKFGFTKRTYVKGNRQEVETELKSLYENLSQSMFAVVLYKPQLVGEIWIGSVEYIK